MASENSEFIKGTQEHEESGYLTKTSNNTGWQINALDEYGEEFVEFAKTCQQPIADLGVAYGFTSKCLLEAGARVIANDLSPEMLHELLSSVTKEQRSRLTLMEGDALKIKIADGSLGGVWANRFLHFLKPEEIREVLKKFYAWLAPGGKVCITAASPYFASAASYLATYEKKKQDGEEWPGFMKAEELPQEWKESSSSIEVGHVIDKDVLEREVQRAGFQVERCSYVARPYASTNGKEGVGIIVVKKG